MVIIHNELKTDLDIDGGGFEIKNKII